MNVPNRQPRAWNADDPDIVEIDEIALELSHLEAETAHDAVETLIEGKRREGRRREGRGREFSWGTMVLGGLSGLALLALGLGLEALIHNLFTRWTWLGWAGAGILALTVIGVVAITIRELRSLARLKHIARIRLRTDAALSDDSRPDADWVCDQILALYRGRPDTARGRRSLIAHRRDIMDGVDLLAHAERELLTNLDRRVRTDISAAAARVSAVTAVSPRALIDVIYVLAESIRLVRRISHTYGARPGMLGFLRLSQAVASHLVVTGTMAAGETLVQQIVGPGLAARISARLGEGVVNGLMTARIGLSAMDVARPLPFIETKRPRLRDLVGDAVARDKQQEGTDS